MNGKRKQEIISLMEQYVKDGSIDMSKFREDHPNEYKLLPHYWNGVNDAVEENGWVKINKKRGQKSKGITLKNQLALIAIDKLLKEDNLTYQEIADRTGVSKAAVSQLHKTLQKQ